MDVYLENLPVVNQKAQFLPQQEDFIWSACDWGADFISCKTPSNTTKLPDSAACRNQIQSEITANHLSQ